MSVEYETALQSFVDYAQSLQDTNHPVDVSFEIMTGKVYDRVVQIYGRQRSAFCFVRKSDGAVLKAASWKAPAKHSRGSIFATDPTGYGIDKYGANYLR